MDIILRYFAEFGSFRGQLRKSGWLAVDLLIVSRHVIKYTNYKHDGRAVLFAVAELLIYLFIYLFMSYLYLNWLVIR